MNQDYLPLVQEEAAEVIKAIAKVDRFGLTNSHPDYHDGAPNWVIVAQEIGDLLECIDRLDLPPGIIEEARKKKTDKLAVYGPDGTYLAGKQASVEVTKS